LAIIDSNEAIGEAFNIGNNQEVTIEDLAKKVIEQTGSSSTIQQIAYEAAYSAGFEDMQRRVPEISKAKALIGWAPTLSLAEIISDVANHLR
jgi:UDP-glucose 4-epimerase